MRSQALASCAASNFRGNFLAAEEAALLKRFTGLFLAGFILAGLACSTETQGATISKSGSHAPRDFVYRDKKTGKVARCRLSGNSVPAESFILWRRSIPG